MCLAVPPCARTMSRVVTAPREVFVVILTIIICIIVGTREEKSLFSSTNVELTRLTERAPEVLVLTPLGVRTKRRQVMPWTGVTSGDGQVRTGPMDGDDQVRMGLVHEGAKARMGLLGGDNWVRMDPRHGDAKARMGLTKKHG